MSKYILIISMIFFSSMTTGFDARAETATETINHLSRDKLDELRKDPKKLKAFIKSLPDLTDEEQKNARDQLKKAQLQYSDSCDSPSCYPKCMLDNQAACCRDGKVCIGCESTDYGCLNVGNPTQAVDETSTYCGVYCLF